MERFTPDKIDELKPNQIFVFGSNTQGKHGAGAAKTARRFGAIYSQATGLQGQTYAIATKNLSQGQRSIPLNTITQQIQTFLDFAKTHPDNAKSFTLTRTKEEP